MPDAGLQAVVKFSLNSGRGSYLGPATARRVRWWELDLVCGHHVQRDARYRQLGDPLRMDDAWRRSRTVADLLPAPLRVRCEQCTGNNLFT
jgi:hypothetical protein